MEKEEIINILSQKKQIILQGAPGTGKTYSTAEIAVNLIDEKVPDDRKEVMKRYKELIKNNQIFFTTFHQSMDYEEFVE
ncbi:AAA family ATPase, partial [Brachyspira hampsonii]|nr:AAA family ATPase [Brachyspira hampsonii]